MVARGAYTPYGAAHELFQCQHPEVLIEGGAGTGKTRAVLERMHFIAQMYPGCRLILARATRASMTETVLVEMEDSVLEPGSVNMLGGTRAHRTAYEYPNGSYMVVTGLDNADRIMSAQYDVAAVFEATETTEDSWEKLKTRLRNNVVPFQQAIADCNPSYSSHWLNKRAKREGRTGQPMMVRLLSRHEDNPTVTKEYIDILDNLTGARYERLRLHAWVDEEGLILPGFDPAVHVVPSHTTTHPDGTTKIKYYIGGIDWGYRNPGCFQVWGVTAEDEMYRVAEVYRRKKHFDWWAEVVAEAHEKYHLRNVVCDPALPDNIGMINDRLTSRGGRSTGAIAVGANNAWMVGRDLVAELLRPTDGTDPRMYFVDDAMEFRGIEKALREENMPTCAEEEIPGITWDEAKEGKEIKERPRSGVPDHAFDVTRYCAMHLWSTGQEKIKAPTLPEGSVGQLLGWEKHLRGA